MSQPTYKLTFLPIFEKDLIEVTSYIANTLQNPEAAHQLLDDIEIAIEKKVSRTSFLCTFSIIKNKRTPLLQNQCAKFLYFLCSYR